jgi:cell division protein FtsI/penicillin-binding protein 2
VNIRKYPLRFCGIFLFLILSLLFFASRLLFTQFFSGDYFAKLAERQHNYSVTLEPVRGTIYDRRLRQQAINIAVYSAFANPRTMSKGDKEKAVQALSSLFSLDKESLRERLSRKKYFTWLVRKVTLEEMQKVKAMKIHGLDFIKESKRYYPNKSLAAQLIGFAGMDNEGLDGLEMAYNRILKGKEGWALILRDARQNELMLEKGYVPPQDGFNLVLTIDETIQYIVERALDNAFTKNNALSATVVVMNPKTGEILALANRPTYNLEDFATSQPEQRTNRAVAYVYEPGSVFKIVAASAALEEDVFKETDKIFCENGEYRVGNHILHDHGSHGSLTFQQVIEQSSNIGTTKVAQKVGATTFYKYAKRFHFGRKTGIDLLGEVNGVLPPPAQWSKTSIGAIPIGHEVLVTPLQLVAAISAIANDGVYMKPFVVKAIKDNNNQVIRSFEPQVVERVISPQTAARLQVILTGVVEEGTGKKAIIPGVKVAGKTGTAQKVISGQYSHSKFFASFIGFAPVDDPKVAVVVSFDEPHPSYFGGTVAAPVFQEIVSNTLKYLQATEPEIPH